MQKQTIMHKTANRYEHQIPMFSFAHQSVSPKFEIRDVDATLISPPGLQFLLWKKDTLTSLGISPHF